MEALHWKQYSWKSICGFVELSRESCKLTGGSIFKLMGGLSLKYQNSGDSIMEALHWKHFEADGGLSFRYQYSGSSILEAVFWKQNSGSITLEAL